MKTHELPSICEKDCPLCLKLGTDEVEQLLGSSVVGMCDTAAAQLALGGLALGVCPLWQQYLYDERSSLHWCR